MKAVIFIISVAFASGSTLVLGENKCSWGPSYWCSHLSKAKECGAVDHCVQTVWTKQKITASPNPECQLCETVLDYARKYLADKTVQDEVTSAADMFCKVTANIPEVKKYCDEIVPLLPTIFSFLTNPKMSSAQLCSFVITGCQATYTVQQKADLQEKQKGDICTDCQALIGDIEQLITSNSTKSQVVALVQQMVCGLFGQEEQVCDELVDTYLPSLLDYLASYVDPDLDCRAIGFCTTGSTPKLMKYQMAMAIFKGYFLKYAGKSFQTSLTGVLGCVECSACEGIIGSLRGLVEEKTVQDHILNFLENDVCEKLPSEMVSDCKATIAKEGPPMLWIMWQSMDPTYLCSDFGMCPSISPNMQQKKMVSGAVECSVCKDAIFAVSKLVSSSFVQKAIAESIENYICPFFGSFESQCKKDVALYILPVMKIVESILQPDMCDRMSLCESKVKVIKENPEECALCELIFQELQKLLVDARTETAIKNALDEVCDQLPSQYKSECDSLVAKNEADILQMLADKIQPTLICSQLTLCSSTSRTPDPVKQQSPVNIPQHSTNQGTNVECTLCEFVMDKLDSMINKNSTEEEIQAALDEVCNLLPSTLTSECVAFVDQYGKTIINLLLNELSPQNICTALGLCAVAKRPPVQELHRVKLTKVLTPISVMGASTLPKNTATCGLCKMVAEKIEELMETNKTEQYIEAGLGEFCKILPSEQATECATFVKTYTKGILILLLDELSPAVVCQQLGLCTAQKSVKVQKKIKANSDECEFCTTVISEVINILKEKPIQDDIKNALDNVCNRLPATYASQCTDFVSTYEAVLIQLLVQELDPKEVCKALTLCTAKVAKVKVSSEECVLCESLLLYVQEALKENKTVQFIEAAIDRFCDKLSFKQQCESLVSEYGTQMAILLSNEIKPNQICKALLKCNSTKLTLKDSFGKTLKEVKSALHEKDTKLYFRKHLLGGDRCKNPGYFCANAKNARKCGFKYQDCRRFRNVMSVVRGL